MIRGCTHVDEPIDKSSCYALCDYLDLRWSTMHLDYFNKWYHKQGLIFRGHGVVDLEEEVKRKDSSN